MTVASVTLLENIFKIRYSQGFAKYLAAKSDLIAWLPLQEDFGGWKWWRTNKTNAVNGSTVFGTARANRSVPNFERFEMTRSQDHVLVSVSCEAARASRKDEYALVQELDDAMDSANDEMAMSIENLLTGIGGGARGQIALVGGIPAVDTILLEDPSKIYLLQEGMVIQVSNDPGEDVGDAVRAGTVTIESINQAAGTFTVDPDLLVGIPAAVVGDYIFREGDLDAGAQRVLQGLFAWCPATAPTAAESFFGVDRSVNVGALAGMRHDGTGGNPLDTIMYAATLVKRNRGMADTVLVNPTKAGEIGQYALAKQKFVQKTDYAGIQLAGFSIETVCGTVGVIACPAIPEDLGMLTKRDAWLMRSLDGFPHPVDDDGQIWHLEEAADAMQARLRYYAQLCHMTPKHSCHITF
jgi:hypothetical protein